MAGHSSEGWYKGYLGQSIRWADLQLCRAVEWLGRVQHAHTSLSPSLLEQSPSNQCRHAAFLKKVKISAWVFGTHLPHPSLPHVFHLLLLQHCGSWSPGQLPAQVITRCLPVFEQDICSPWFPVLHACAGLQAACHPEQVYFPGKGTHPSVSSSSTKWAFCKYGIM